MIAPLTLEQAHDDVVAVIDMLSAIPEDQRDDRLQRLLTDLENAITQYDVTAPPP